MCQATDKSKNIEINDDTIKLDKKILKFTDSKKQIINNSKENENFSNSDPLNTNNNEFYKAILNK